MKNRFCDVHRKRLCETLPLSSHNICFLEKHKDSLTWYVSFLVYGFCNIANDGHCLSKGINMVIWYREKNNLKAKNK